MQTTLRKLSSKKRILVCVVLIAIILTIAFYFHNQQSSEQQNTNYDFVSVRKGNIEEIVTAQGKLEPQEYVDVGTQVSGQLKKLYFDIGDSVTQGDLLAEIDPKIYEARVQADEARIKTLEASILQQEAQITFAQRQLTRNERLIKSKAISQEALEETQTNLKVAQAQAASLQAQLEEAKSSLEGDQANLSYTKIYAPMSGTVVVQSAREGQTLNANQQAPIILQLANLDKMTVRAQVAEADVMRLKSGSEAYFTTLGSTERRWSGTVRQILPSPEVINDVVLYNALIDVDNKDRTLLPGMSTQIFFVRGQAKNVLIIPIAALGKKASTETQNDSETYKIIVEENGMIQEKTIQTGLQNRSDVEVKSGLLEGDKVAIPRASNISSDRPNRGPRMMGPRL